VEGTPDAGSTTDISARRGRVHTTPNSCSGVTGTVRSVQGTRPHEMGRNYWQNWRRALVVEHLSARDSIKGALREGFFTGEPERRGFWQICKMPCKWALPLHRGPVGEPGGGSFAGTFERSEKYTWVPFLDTEAIKILSLGAIWNLSKGTGLCWVDIRLWSTKSPSIRPRCIGTMRARTKC